MPQGRLRLLDDGRVVLTPKTVWTDVVMPSYIVARFVGEAIESVFGQTHADLELIVVDDGSSDGTVDVVRRYSPPVHLVTLAHTGMPGLVRNRGLARATGQLIAFLMPTMREDEGEARLLPFEASFFDLVYAGEIIEHVLDTVGLLRGVYRVLRPGGAAVLTTPNLCSLKNLYCWLASKQLAWVDYKAGRGHVRYFSPATLADVLAESGFVVERMCSSGIEVGAHVPALAFLTALTRLVFAHSVRGNCLIVRAARPAEVSPLRGGRSGA